MAGNVTRVKYNIGSNSVVKFKDGLSASGTPAVITDAGIVINLGTAYVVNILNLFVTVTTPGESLELTFVRADAPNAGGTKTPIHQTFVVNYGDTVVFELPDLIPLQVLEADDVKSISLQVVGSAGSVDYNLAYHAEIRVPRKS